MADIWNPLDDKNPIYKEMAKRSRLQSKQIRNTVIVGGILLAGYFASKPSRTPIIGDFFGSGPQLDNLGLIRRKW